MGFLSSPATPTIPTNETARLLRRVFGGIHLLWCFTANSGRSGTCPASGRGCPERGSSEPNRLCRVRLPGWAACSKRSPRGACGATSLLSTSGRSNGSVGPRALSPGAGPRCEQRTPNPLKPPLPCGFWRLRVRSATGVCPEGISKNRRAVPSRSHGSRRLRDQRWWIKVVVVVAVLQLIGAAISLLTMLGLRGQ
jgi:hypothetical protein